MLWGFRGLLAIMQGCCSEWLWGFLVPAAVVVGTDSKQCSGDLQTRRCVEFAALVRELIQRHVYFSESFQLRLSDRRRPLASSIALFTHKSAMHAGE